MGIQVPEEHVTFKIEYEDDPQALLLVLDRKCDVIALPWRDADALAVVIDAVIADVKDQFPSVTDLPTMIKEQEQIKFNHRKGLVYLFIEWSDRVRFTSLDALKLVNVALKRNAQDANLVMRGVHFKYARGHLIKEIHNTKLDTVQKVR